MILLKDQILTMRFGTNRPGNNAIVYSDVGSIAMATKVSRRLVEAVLLSFEYDRLSKEAKAIVDRDRLEAETLYRDKMLAKD